MGQVKSKEKHTRYWLLTNYFMVKDYDDFSKWVKEISEAYDGDLVIEITKNEKISDALNEVIAILERNDCTMDTEQRPKETVCYGLYIEGDLPTLRMKSVAELQGAGESDVIDPDIRDIDFLDELSKFLRGGEVALVGVVGVAPRTAIVSKGYIVTSDGAVITPVPMNEALLPLAKVRSKYPVIKLPE